MAVIVTLLSPPQLQRLRFAVRDRHELIVCESWDALMGVCERQPVRLALIDLFADRETSFDRIRRLKQRLPGLSLICYVSVTLDRARDLFDAGRHGMDGLVITDRDDAPMELLRIIDIAESRALADRVRRQLSGTDSVVYDAVMLSITRAHERLSPVRLAKLLGMPSRTVSQRLYSAGFPSALRLLTWGRLIVAAHMMDDRRRSADRVAASLEFPSGSAFRNTCQRYLHASPREIRSRGGAQYVIRSFFRLVQSARTSAPASAPRGARRLALAV